MKNIVLYAFIGKMANEVVSTTTKDVIAVQSTSARKDEQHMLVLECARLCEHFRFCFLEATQKVLSPSSLLF